MTARRNVPRACVQGEIKASVGRRFQHSGARGRMRWGCGRACSRARTESATVVEQTKRRSMMATDRGFVMCARLCERLIWEDRKSFPDRQEKILARRKTTFQSIDQSVSQSVTVPPRARSIGGSNEFRSRGNHIVSMPRRVGARVGVNRMKTVTPHTSVAVNYFSLRPVLHCTLFSQLSGGDLCCLDRDPMSCSWNM